MNKPKTKRLGALPKRYKFILNPYVDLRLSTCPKCERLTYPRKFPLFIHVGGTEPGCFAAILGKTCKYCPKCEIIMAHKDELDPLVAEQRELNAPALTNHEYLVMGTVELKFWKKSLTEPQTMDEVMKHTAQFKDHLTLHYQPAGWYHKDYVPEWDRK
jgi:Zn-finger nucleic acid-binding protein